MNLSTFLRLEVKNFLSDKAVIVAVLCLCLAGTYAMYHGKDTIGKQKEVIAQIPKFQTEHTEKLLELQKDDLGNLLYYHQFSTVHQPSNWAAFSIGQRDVNPFNVKVTMLTLEGQIYDSEMSNPINLLYGNFDLAFVFVFLFPLVIIAFCHSLISAEQESGIWNLLRSQPVSMSKIVGLRVLIRFLTVLLLGVALLSANCFYQESSFDMRFAYALLITFSYLVFWFALSTFIVSLQQSSTINALSLLGVWIFLTILAPALLNLIISTALPVSESFELTIKQREGYHQTWDKAKAETMEKFFVKYPQFREFPIPEDKFSWGWYYAAQNMGDEESADETARYMDKLKLRDNWTNLASLLLPTVNAQLAYSRLSQNDLQSHLDYLESVRMHHAQIREHFYPFIFKNSKVQDVDWQNLPKHNFNSELQSSTFPTNILGVVFAAMLLGGLARKKLGVNLK